MKKKKDMTNEELAREHRKLADECMAQAKHFAGALRAMRR